MYFCFTTRRHTIIPQCEQNTKNCHSYAEKHRNDSFIFRIKFCMVFLFLLFYIYVKVQSKSRNHYFSFLTPVTRSSIASSAICQCLNASLSLR